MEEPEEKSAPSEAPYFEIIVGSAKRFFATIHRYTDCRPRTDTPIHRLLLIQGLGLFRVCLGFV